VPVSIDLALPACTTRNALHRTPNFRANSRQFAVKHEFAVHHRAGVFQVGGKLPFDKLRANEKAYPFALSLSKGKFAPKLKYAPPRSNSKCSAASTT
jgi:hypothetical protein